MEILLIINIIFTIGFYAFAYLLLNKQNKESNKKIILLSRHLALLKKRIDDIFVQPTSPEQSPNEVTEVDPDIIELSEDRPLDLPSDLKIEIEGGDTHIPPNFQV